MADLIIIVEDELNIFSKTKNMSGLKREQLWILTVLVLVKTGAKTVKYI